MPKCPNCGQPTERTEDWACQWCGYPLFSTAYKKISKTYKQRKEENLSRQPPPLIEEPEPELIPEPEPTVEAELPPEPETEPVLEPVPEPPPETSPEPPTVLETRPEQIAVPEPAAEAELPPEPEPVPVLKPAPEPQPTTAAEELTVEELLAAYGIDAEAADTRFANNILKVTGFVDRIEVKDTFGIYYITLTNTEQNAVQGVRCVFDSKHGAELNQLTKGQEVTVLGKYDGSLIDIKMKGCSLVH